MCPATVNAVQRHIQRHNSLHANFLLVSVQFVIGQVITIAGVSPLFATPTIYFLRYTPQSSFVYERGFLGFSYLAIVCFHRYTRKRYLAPVSASQPQIDGIPFVYFIVCFSNNFKTKKQVNICHF